LVNTRLFQALQARARKLQQVVDQSQGNDQIDPQNWTRAEQISKSLRAQVSHLMEMTNDPEMYSGLEEISAKLEALIEQLNISEGSNPE
jgi:hypothetical protein